MKKKLLFLLLPLAFGMVACGPETPSSSAEPIPDPSSLPLVEGEVVVYYFASSTQCNKNDPFYKGTYEVGSKLSKPNEVPTSNDPAFDIFLGWSAKTFAMSDEDYWDFDNDVIPGDLIDHEFYIYGQWDTSNK